MMNTVQQVASGAVTACSGIACATPSHACEHRWVMVTSEHTRSGLERHLRCAHCAARRQEWIPRAAS